MSSAIAKDDEDKKDGDKNTTEEEASKLRCNHASTSKCPNCIGKTASAAPAKVKCHHGSNSKCPNCMNEDAGMVADRKHEAFDKFTSEMRRKCAKTHAENMKCQNCAFSQSMRYVVDYDCKFHPPYP